MLGNSLPKVEIFAILGGAFPVTPPVPIGVKFCAAKRTHTHLGCAKFHVNWCNESPMQGENDFRPMSKFNTGNSPLNKANEYIRRKTQL